MALASMLFWIICAIPLIGIMYYLIRKDKNKFAGIWGVIILGVLVIGALLAIVFITKDFKAVFNKY